MPTPGRRPAQRRGAMLPLVAALLPVLLILASFVVNLAYMELTRTELRIASDAATRAAGYELSRTQDRTAARTLARDAATRNKVAGKATQLANGDIVFGVSRRSSLASRYTFTSGGTQVNAVRVNARRNSGSLSGVVNLVMPSFGAVKSFGPAQLAISTQVECDIALVIDRSGSMAYSDTENSSAMAAVGLPPASAPPGWAFCDPAPPGARWHSVVAAVGVFFNALQRSPQQEIVSLSTYATDAKMELPLSSNYGPIGPALDVYTQKYCTGLTNIHDGIVAGANTLASAAARDWAAKVIIVLTDGRRTIGADPVDAARSAFNQGIPVYTVTFSNEADISAMRDVANVGGGKHFHASTGAELRKVFDAIASKLPILLTQ